MISNHGGAILKAGMLERHLGGIWEASGRCLGAQAAMGGQGQVCRRKLNFPFSFFCSFWCDRPFRVALGGVGRTTVCNLQHSSTEVCAEGPSYHS